MSDPRNTTRIADIAPYIRLVRHDPTGIAAVLDGHGGGMHTCHPNIMASGSVRGMKNLGYWRRNDRAVRAMGYIYNTSELVVSSDYDRIAALACRCGGEACYRYQLKVGVRSTTTGLPAVPDGDLVQEAARIEAAAQARIDQRRIPLEHAEDSVMVHFSIPICIDPEGMPEPGDPERNRILAENVLDWMLSADIDPRDFKGSAELFAEYIDRDELLERRDIRALSPTSHPSSSNALAEAARNTIEMHEDEANAFA